MTEQVTATLAAACHLAATCRSCSGIQAGEDSLQTYQQLQASRLC